MRRHAGTYWKPLIRSNTRRVYCTRTAHRRRATRCGSSRGRKLEVASSHEASTIEALCADGSARRRAGDCTPTIRVGKVRRTRALTSAPCLVSPSVDTLICAGARPRPVSRVSLQHKTNVRSRRWRAEARSGRPPCWSWRSSTGASNAGLRSSLDPRCISHQRIHERGVLRPE